MNVRLDSGRKALWLASDGSSVDFFKAGVTTAHFNDEREMPSRNDALKSRVMNGESSLTNSLTSHVGVGSNSVFVGRLCYETLNHGDVDGVKATNQLCVQVEDARRRRSCC